MPQESVSVDLNVSGPLVATGSGLRHGMFFFCFQSKNALQSVLVRISSFTMLDLCVFLCCFSSTVHTSVRFDYVFFNMDSFTKFIIFVTEPCLFTNTILLEHASLHQRTMHCPLLACVCLLPCTFHF